MAAENDGAMADPVAGRFFPPATLPFARGAAEAKADPLKGETEAMLAHARDILAVEDADTSKDAAWTVEPPDCADKFKMLVLVLCCGVKGLLVGPVLLLLLLPPVTLNAVFVFCCLPPAPLNQIDRSTFGWKVHVFFQCVFAFPASLVVALNTGLDYALMFLIGSVYCTLFCKWGRYFKNLRVFDPYRGGPSLLLHVPDLVAAAAGMMYRQGFWEFISHFMLMFIYNPWAKHWLIANAWMEELGERFVTQIGQTMDDIPIDVLDVQAQFQLSATKPSMTTREQIDAAFFSPHYPFPPAPREYAVAMQHANGAVTTVVHTTHFRAAPADKPLLCLSRSAELPVVRVMLFNGNPFHLFTGWVEAGVSNGQPSQPDKMHGMEHPMWLVTGHSALANDRASRFGAGQIDGYFDRFIPYFQRIIRLNVRGRQAADEMFAKDPQKGFETAGAGGGAQSPAEQTAAAVAPEPEGDSA